MLDLVAIDLPGGQPLVDSVRRAWDDGDAVLPLHHRDPLRHRRGLAVALGAAWLVDTDGWHRLEGGRPVLDGDAAVIATSGTTGDPKGVVVTHRAVEYAAYASATALDGADGSTHWLACLPLSHVGGFSVITRALLTGAGLTVHDGFSSESVAAAARHGATHVSLVPTALARIDPTPWRRILLGGATAPDDRPANCVATYGMTETFGGVVYDGQPLPGVEVRIAGAPPGAFGVSGVIELRSPTLLRGYRAAGSDRSDDDAEPALGPDGWFHTRDIGAIDAHDHRLCVHGRADDLIVTGGENVWPARVEARLVQHPAVSEAAVVGRPDPEWGERVCAVVVPAHRTSPPTLAELRAFVRERLPVACAPKELDVVDRLPRTSLGKLRRRSLAGDG